MKHKEVAFRSAQERSFAKGLRNNRGWHLLFVPALLHRANGDSASWSLKSQAYNLS